MAAGADQQVLDQPQTPPSYGSAHFVRSAATLFGTPDLFNPDAATTLHSPQER